MSFVATLLMDGVDVSVHVDDHNDIAISIDKAEASHFSPHNIELLIACLMAAVEETEEESK